MQLRIVCPREIDPADFADRTLVDCLATSPVTFWSIGNARRVIGYQPQDDSEQVFAADIAAMLARG